MRSIFDIDDNGHVRLMHTEMKTEDRQDPLGRQKLSLYLGGWTVAEVRQTLDRFCIVGENSDYLKVWHEKENGNRVPVFEFKQKIFCIFDGDGVAFPEDGMQWIAITDIHADDGVVDLHVLDD